MGIQIWNIDKILTEAKYFIKEFGELPGRKKLTKMGRGDFINAVNKYYPGNMTQLRIDLNAPTGQKPSGYWTKEQIIKESKKLIKKEKEFPSQKRLSELGLNTISIYAQRYFGGLYGLAIACGINSETLWTKSGHWKNIENIKKEIEVVIDQLGRFPTTTDLRRIGKHNLLSAISSNFDGIKNVRKILGYTKKLPIAKDGHYCDSFSEVIVDDFLFMNDIPHKRNIQFNFTNIKCRPDFILENMTIVEVLMADYRINNHKGRYKQYVTRYRKKRKAYLDANMDLIEVFPCELTDKDKMEKKFEIIANKVNAPFPYKLEDFTNIIFFDKKSPGYWSIADNIKKELLPLVKKYGKIPSIKLLREIGRHDIEGAIINNYGSYRAVGEVLGLDVNSIMKPQKYWQDIRNIKKELAPIISQYGYIPGKSELKRIGKSSLVAAVESYFISFKDLANKLGTEYKTLKLSNGHWQNIDNIQNELDKVVKKLKRFPTAKDFKSLRLSGLLKGILNNFGTLRDAAIELGFDAPQNKPKGYWKIKRNLFEELDQFYQKYNCIPSCKIIEKENSMLMYSIRNYHGGMIKMRTEYLSLRDL
ncbi:MAG: hypothetical protein KDC90_17195 [Ignavibacteriae bacterium]|nr:hypothetical protein [Ignavibacteriota bacterium]